MAKKAEKVILQQEEMTYTEVKEAAAAVGMDMHTLRVLANVNNTTPEKLLAVELSRDIEKTASLVTPLKAAEAAGRGLKKLATE